MKCFDKLLQDFVSAARSGQVLEPTTETQRRVMHVLAKKAADQGIELDGFEIRELSPTNGHSRQLVFT
ncbi:MAG: hypothetical protein WC919_02035 [Candidatus Paceibacterota bacterium]|jgi:hypothetical protein